MNHGRESRIEHLVVAIMLNLGPSHWVEGLRQKFDPLYAQVQAHITLLHPFQADFYAVDPVLTEVARRTGPFGLICQEITAFDGEYLFLNVKGGNDQVIALRDELYRALLPGKKPDSVTFVPHVTVGRCKSGSALRKAMGFCRMFEGRVEVAVSSITCYGIAHDGRRLVLASYLLGLDAA